jgi:hypothetical protein
MEVNMTTINAETYRGTVLDLLKDTVLCGHTVNAWSSTGNAVILSEETYRGLLETLRIEAVPGLKGKILAAATEPLSASVPLEEIDW